MTIARLTVERVYHADLFYHCLSQVDVRGDASNLYSPTYCEEMDDARRLAGSDPGGREWQGALARAFAEVPHGYWLTFLPFFVGCREELLALVDAMAAGCGALRPELDLSRFPHLAEALSCDAVRPFADLLGGALRSEEKFYRGFHERMEVLFAAHAASFETFLNGECSPFLEKIAESLGGASVRLLLTPGIASGGRAIALEEESLHVAVTLPRGVEGQFEAFFQAFHEMTHFVTNGEILKGGSDVTWDTRAGAPGFDTHQLLESAAHDFDSRIFSRGAERFRLRYIEWARRWGFYS